MEYYRRDELYHHGIKGMRWGIRRYQNPDGTLTEAGRKRQDKLKRREEKDREFAKKRYGISDKQYDEAMDAVKKRNRMNDIERRANARATAKVAAGSFAAALAVGAVAGLVISKISSSESVAASYVNGMMRERKSGYIYGPGVFDFGSIPVGFVIKK